MAKKKAEVVKDPIQSQMGSIITIVGVPRADLDNVDNDETVRRLREEAERVMDNVEITHMPNVDLGAPLTYAEKQRGEAVLHAFGVANRWSTAPELTPRERVHGATRELYHHYGPTQARDEHGRFVHVEAGPEYDAHYEAHFAEDIKFRSIRAAKDLFGGK
jgi:hypothetical protein